MRFYSCRCGPEVVEDFQDHVGESIQVRLPSKEIVQGTLVSTRNLGLSVQAESSPGHWHWDFNLLIDDLWINRKSILDFKFLS